MAQSVLTCASTASSFSDFLMGCLTNTFRSVVPSRTGRCAVPVGVRVLSASVIKKVKNSNRSSKVATDHLARLEDGLFGADIDNR